MSNRVLILSMPNDLHAFAVKEAIDRLGGEAHLYISTNFPILNSESIEVTDSGGLSIDLNGLPLGDGSGDGWTVWYRRPGYQIDAARLDPADRGFASLQCRLFRSGLKQHLLPEAFWVNPFTSQDAEIKPCQQRAAIASGLTVPETLYTNDPDKIRTFLRKHDDSVIYKPLLGTTWRDEERHHRVTFSSMISENDLVSDHLLKTVPGIYQKYVEKDYELRVTFVGQKALAAKVLSQQSEFGRVDWRQSYDDLQMEEFELPESIYRSCLEVMERLDIVFGCFDFIVTPEGEYIFLEVNQMGQWLFVEMLTGMPILDTFSRYLLDGSSDVETPGASNAIRYSEVEGLVDDQIKVALETGVIPPDWIVDERRSQAATG